MERPKTLMRLNGRTRWPALRSGRSPFRGSPARNGGRRAFRRSIAAAGGREKIKHFKNLFNWCRAGVGSSYNGLKGGANRMLKEKSHDAHQV